MGQEQENVARLAAAYAEWARIKAADHRCWLDLAADDVTLRSLAGGRTEMAFTKPRDGKAELLGYLTELTDAWDMVEYEMGDFIAEGDRVVAIGRVAWRSKANGAVAETPKIDVWRFKDGKAVEFHEFYDTARVYEVAARQPVAASAA
jgi:ketosteroid isomerase-like protein